LLLAVMRSLPGPVFFPFRLMAISYIELFRAVPGILVIFLLALGVPGLRIPGLVTEFFFWGVVALVLVWSAYVAEVYRAGIEAVHSSQEAAARSLGLSRLQGLRYVVLPQAVRRVIPPLLNDFIGLQKDTALVSFVGVVEVFRRSQIIAGGAFNFTPYVVCALFFLAMTIPLARLVDHFAVRDRRRQLAGTGGR
jgi:polar amino acid transport system permease protein